MPRFQYCITILALFLMSSSVYAAHPLITDDTGTQGRGKFQVEVNGGYSRSDSNGVVETGTELAAAIAYGITDTLDLSAGLPYAFLSVEEGGRTTREDGISDMDISMKWRFYETEGFSLAVKPGITLPTGDDEKGLGAGKVGMSVFFIATKELKPLVFHLNLGYIRNENDFAERKDLWHASLASEMGVVERLRLVLNTGIEQNPDRASTAPAFVLAGLIYSVADNLDIDGGLKLGLNNAEADYQLLAGITYRF